MTESAWADAEVVVIGSGFGGCMAALPLVEAGKRVLMLERGDWVGRGEENWGDGGVFVLTPHYTSDGSLSLRTRRGWKAQGICACVGGPSVFYGGASFRYREEDFVPRPEIVGSSEARWPLAYHDLEPFYGWAEALLGVAGEAGTDPTEPFRSSPYPRTPLPASRISQVIMEAAAGLGLQPFRIPMAIDQDSCKACCTCDAFACAVEAKNDLATRIIPYLLAKGMGLRSRTAALRLVRDGPRISEVVALAERNGEIIRIAAKQVILAAGALATPTLVLASDLAARNPGRDAIGKYLMRHCNAMMYGFFSGDRAPGEEHHKQVALHDFYFGDPERPELGKLGNLQQVMTPPISLLRAMLPRGIGTVAAGVARQLTGMLAIAEDQPSRENRVELRTERGRSGALPRGRIHHRYTRRDLAARRALLRRARQILKAAGAHFTIPYPVTTFSHALGTLRMGDDPEQAPLDRLCRFRGLDNLYVTDASVLPTSAGVNPSLTIAANALRVGAEMAAAG